MANRDEPRSFISCGRRNNSSDKVAPSEEEDMLLSAQTHHLREHGSLESLDTAHSLKPDAMWNSNHHLSNSAAAYSPRTGYSNGPLAVPNQLGTPGLDSHLQHAAMMASNHRIQLPMAFYSEGFPQPAFPQPLPADYDYMIPQQGSRLTLDPRADVLCVVLHKVVIANSPINQQGSLIQILPCVHGGEIDAGCLGETISVGRKHIGAYYEAHINSGLLRFHYDDRRLLTLKVVETFEDKREIIGLVRLSNLPRNILNEEIDPEHVINRPEFCKSFPIEDMPRGQHCGKLFAGVLFDYRRPGEYPWPHPNSAPTPFSRSAPLRQKSEPRRREIPPAAAGTHQRSRVRGSVPPGFRTRHHQEGGGWLSDTLRTFCLQLPDALC